MNKKIKARWLKALRSGKYEQTKGLLRHKGGYCCLGVLCDLYSKSKKVPWHNDTIEGAGFTLPSKVQQWAGLQEGNPDVKVQQKGRMVTTNLANLNDGMDGFKRRTFKQIAKIIEKQL